MLGQTQATIQKAENIIMRINREMTSNPESLTSSDALCHYLKIDKPIQEIIKTNLILFHKILENKKPQSIMNQIKIPNRSCGKLYVKDYPIYERSQRSPLAAGLKLLNAVDPDTKILPNKVLKRKLKTHEVKYSIFK